MVLVTCDLFKPSLTIINNSSHDIDRIEWIVNGEEYWFGDDSVWDSTLSKYEVGIAINSSSTRDVEAGSSYIYFNFADDAQRYRTSEKVAIEARHDATFTFDDSTTVVPY